MDLFVTVTIRVNTAAQPNATSVATLQELALAIHAAASQIDTGGPIEDELGIASVRFQGRRVGHLDVRSV